jgi:hypothetical protein
VLRPSVARVWACRSPRRSASSTSRGSAPLRAASSSPCSSRGGGLEEATFGLLAEAGERAQPPFARRFLELRERGEALPEERPHALGTEPRHGEELRDAGGEALAQPLEQFAAAACRDLAHLAGEIRADPGELGQLAARGERRRDVQPELAHHARGVAVGAHPERVLVAQLEESGDLLEGARDVRVMNRHGRGRRACRPRGAQ